MCIRDRLNDNSVHFDEIGKVIEDKLQFKDELNTDIRELSKKYKTWLESYMVN